MEKIIKSLPDTPLSKRLLKNVVVVDVVVTITQDEVIGSTDHSHNCMTDDQAIIQLGRFRNYIRLSKIN